MSGSILNIKYWTIGVIFSVYNLEQESISVRWKLTILKTDSD